MCNYRKARNFSVPVPLYKKKKKKKKLFYIRTFIAVLTWAEILSDWALFLLQQALFKDKPTDD